MVACVMSESKSLARQLQELVGRMKEDLDSPELAVMRTTSALGSLVPVDWDPRQFFLRRFRTKIKRVLDRH